MEGKSEIIVATRAQLQELARQKVKEAKHLFRGGYFNGAYYIGGYAIELALKARICKNLDKDDLFGSKYVSNFKLHDFSLLLLHSGLLNRKDEEESKNLEFRNNWDIVKNWKETSRYYLTNSISKNEAEEFLHAITQPKNGIFSWIKKCW